MATNAVERAERQDQGAAQSVADLVSQGMAIIKVENDSMLQMAAQRPRNEKVVLSGALGELELVPEEAKEAFYTIPYREKQPDGGYRIVNVQGPSIGAAMALARRWGNCSTGARIVNEDREGFDIDGVFIDLESNFRVSKPFRVGKYGKSRGGGVYQLDPQKLLMAVQAGASKALRNSIIAGLPKYLVAAYYNKARQISGGHPDLKAEPKRVEALLKAYERHKVTKEMLETYCERPVAEWTGEEISNLRGLWNALQDKQVTVEETFGGGTPEAQAKAASNAPTTVTPDSITSGTATGQDNAPDPVRPQPAAAVPPGCLHPGITPAVLGNITPDQSWPCETCGEVFKGTKKDPFPTHAEADAALAKDEAKATTVVCLHLGIQKALERSKGRPVVCDVCDEAVKPEIKLA